MAFLYVQPSSMADLISRVNTFLVADGWTSDHFATVSGKAAWHKSTVYVSVRWDTSSPLAIAIYHALGFTDTATLPGNHPNDSGNGQITGTDATIRTGRYIGTGNTPLGLWCFSGTTYAHFVVHQLGTRYAHFGFGILDKVGNWTGGEYAYGTRQEFDFDSSPVHESSTFLLDGVTSSGGPSPMPTDMELYAATVHVEGMTNQGGTSKWAVAMSASQSAILLGTDRASVARIHFIGGFRAGLIASPFGAFAGIATKAHVPMYPIMTSYFNRTTGNVQVMGFQKDVRGVSIQNFEPEDEITIGNDTWMIFPSGQKWISGVLTSTTGYQGIAYRVNA